MALGFRESAKVWVIMQDPIAFMVWLRMFFTQTGFKILLMIAPIESVCFIRASFGSKDLE
jgi:hypothetical protein